MKDVCISREAQEALVKLLAKLGLISEKLAQQPWSPSDYCPVACFARQGHYKEDEALALLSKKLPIPLFTLERGKTYQIAKLLDHQSLSAVTPQAWRQMRAMPIEVHSDHFTIAMANPLDYQLRKSLEFELGRRIEVVLGKEEEIVNLLAKKLDSHYTLDFDSLLETSSQTTQPTEAAAHLEPNISMDDVTAAPVVRLANKILADAVRCEASDIHLNPEKDNLLVKVRVDGILRPLFAVPNNVQQAVISRLKLLAGMDIAERRKPQEGRLRIKTDLGLRDLRFSTVPTIYGENVVIRVLSPDLSKVTFEALGISRSLQEKFSLALSSSSQVFLVTGPTGSGKTSTLYACLLHLRDGTSNLVTIEDPIEYRIQGLNQIQVNPKLDITFAQGLRSVLRQDPDIIMVGEIRDYETGAAAMQAAQTGHLVLSTLHTNSAASAITRLKDLGIPSYLIASSLGTVVAQRLVRKLCPFCSVPLRGIDLTPYLALGLKPDNTRAAIGCSECSNTGFKGRTGLFSFLSITDAVREAIRKEMGEQAIEERARNDGFRSLVEAGIELLNSGVTAIDELERALGPLQALAQNEGNSLSKPGFSWPAIKPDFKTLPAHGPLARQRVLLVDDDDNVRLVLSLLLKREMYEVVEARDGLEALEKVYQEPPQIIILDIMMPRMNGVEILKKLRRDPRLRSIPVLMLTAADSESNEIQLINDGADDFISKTADSKVMLARIHRLLERSSNNT